MDFMPEPITFFAKTSGPDAAHMLCPNQATCPYGHGNLPRPHPESTVFGIRHHDRRLHVWAFGRTGMGKSNLLHNLSIMDMRVGQGLAVIDPHGDLVTKLLSFVPRRRTGDVIYFDPSDLDYPIGLNILTSVDKNYHFRVADQVISVFQHFWHDSWGPRLEDILRYSLLALLEVRGSTLLGIPMLINNPSYRAWVVDNLQDAMVKKFWTDDFPRAHKALQQEASAPVLNKVRAFLGAPPLRHILGQPHSTLDFSRIMDQGGIFLANLSKGKIGEHNSALLGSLLISKFFLSALARQDQPEEERQDFFLVIDEASSLASKAFESLVSEARKYRLSLTLANQYLDQFPQEITKALLGNVGTQIAFSLGSPDAETLGRHAFAPKFNAQDLERLGAYHIAIKLAINGLSSMPFAATTLPPFEPVGNEATPETIIKCSRERYALKREIVEERIQRWLAADTPMRHVHRRDLPRPTLQTPTAKRGWE
jgi:hypothetical protein